MKSFKIGKHVVGAGRPFIIAEIAQAHDGNLNFAHNFIDLIADTGADAIKFQMHIPEYESTLEEPFRVPFTCLEDNRYDYWARMNFTDEGWASLVKHGNERGIIFLATPLCVEAIQRLDRLGVPAFKIGSGEVMTPDLFDEMAKIKKPVLLSTGMSSFAMIEDRVNFMRAHNMDFALFQCTTKYPTPLSEVGFNVMQEFRKRFDCPAGISIHATNPNIAMLALGAGADMVEFHVTLHPRAFGPDVPGSLTIEQTADVVRARNEYQEMLNSPVDKDAVAAALAGSYKIFSKSVALRTEDADAGKRGGTLYKQGTVLTRAMLVLRKPGGGIHPNDIEKIVGRKLARDLNSREKVLRPTDIESK
jgi:N,N'-diacetyllegionaminate synthase